MLTVDTDQEQYQFLVNVRNQDSRNNQHEKMSIVGSKIVKMWKVKRAAFDLCGQISMTNADVNPPLMSYLIRW